MNGWYSAADLVGVAGLPRTVRGINKHAAVANWASRPRAGRGGGREYDIRSLPKAVQTALLLREAPPAPALPVPAVAGPVTTALVPAAGQTAGLKDWQRTTMDARLVILREIERLGAVIGTDCAVRTFIEGAERGELAPALAAALPQALGKGKARLTPSRATVYGWMKAHAAGGNSALAPVAPQRGPAVPVWGPFLLGFFQRPQKPSLAWALEELAKNPPAGVDLPSYDQARRFLRRMDAIEREKGRRGPREMKNIKGFVRRSTEHMLPSEAYSMNGHTFDAEIAHPLHGRPFRPEITTVIDVSSRRIVGWSAGLAESAWAVMDALRDAVVTNGIPSILYVDNGSGYRNALMENEVSGFLARLSITMRNSIAYNSQARGVIERLHSTLWVRAAKELPTYIGATMDPEAKKAAHKLTRAEVKAAGKSRILPAWDAFCRFAAARIDAYNDRPHSSLPKVRGADGTLRHQSPNEAWAAAVEHGVTLWSVSEFEAADLWRPYELRTVSRCEVSLRGNHYYSADLEPYHGEQVRVGYEIHDAERVWVRNLDGQLIAIAGFEANKRQYFPVSELERAAEKRAAGRLHRANKLIDEIEAERAGARRGLPEPQPLTAEQTAIAEAALARMQAEQLARDADAAREAAEAEALRARLAAPAAPVATLPAPGARPRFGSDLEYVLWVEANPALATDEDRVRSARLLEESASLRLLAQMAREEATRHASRG